jgi:hypothetical protein
LVALSEFGLVVHPSDSCGGSTPSLLLYRDFDAAMAREGVALGPLWPSGPPDFLLPDRYYRLLGLAVSGSELFVVRSGANSTAYVFGLPAGEFLRTIELESLDPTWLGGFSVTEDRILVVAQQGAAPFRPQLSLFDAATGRHLRDVAAAMPAEFPRASLLGLSCSAIR